MRNISIISALLLSIIMFYSSCSSDGNPYTIYKIYREGAYIRLDGGELSTSCRPDSLVTVTSYNAEIKGFFTYADGDTVLYYGHCWSTSPDPRVAVDTMRSRFSSNDPTNFDPATIIDTRTAHIGLLAQNTTYYLRSYVITGTPQGKPVDTGYNPETLVFNTLPPINEWEQRNNFNGSARVDPISFTIGTKAYIGTGDIGNQFTNDFWEYDSYQEQWKQLADVPGFKRTAAVGFSIGSKGYVGLGAINSVDKVSDFYEYEPSSGIWAPLEYPFNGFPRSHAIAFSIDVNDDGITDRAYVGLGEANSPKYDFHEFNPSNAAIGDAVWQQRTSPFPSGPGRTRCISFSISSIGYIGLGVDEYGNFLKDMRKYNPIFDSWYQVSDFPGEARANAVGFEIDNQGYIGMGDNITISGTGSMFSDFWEYDPFNDRWFERASYKINSENTLPKYVTEATSFSIGRQGFVVGGRVPLGTDTELSREVWTYRPYGD